MSVSKEELETQLLAHLNTAKVIEDSLAYVNEDREAHKPLVSVLKSLKSIEFVTLKDISETEYLITEAGKDVLSNGTVEAQIFEAVKGGPVEKKDLEAKFPRKVIGSTLKLKWIKISKQEGGAPSYEVAVDSVNDAVRSALQDLMETPAADQDGVWAKHGKVLKKAKVVKTGRVVKYHVSQGANFALKRPTMATDLSAQLLSSGEYKEVMFKPYNLKAKGVLPSKGSLHPLMKVRAEFRKVLFSMGFTEMPTNNYVESSFWNFDTLFQPQQHPARDAHDTFFLTEPSTTLSIGERYMERVRATHQRGGVTESIGWRYPWSEKEARKNVLRTHTTAVSSRMLYALAQEALRHQQSDKQTNEEHKTSSDSDKDTPTFVDEPIPAPGGECSNSGEVPGQARDSSGFRAVKYFSIDRVFRNETLDATHLAEFHQVEGLVADKNLTLGHLIGVIREFFRRIGISDLRFKPAYNPYTEPSMEIFGFSKELKKWIEVGNSGIFRPEMLEPMGLPKDVRVIAWGLSLERPTMIKYGIDNIRDLFGPKVKIQMIKNNPIARFDEKEQPKKSGKTEKQES